jgi:hypothetical protein
MLCLTALLLIPFMVAMSFPFCWDYPPRQQCHHDPHYQLVRVADGAEA